MRNLLPEQSFIKKFSDRLKPFGCREDHDWRNAILAQLVPLAGSLASDYERTAKERDQFTANTNLRKIYERLIRRDFFWGELNLSWNEYELDHFAEETANKAKALVDRFEHERASTMLKARIESYDIPYPLLDEDNYEAANNRLCDAQWWRQKLRRMQAETLEQVHRELGRVNRYKDIYISSDNLQRSRRRKQSNENVLNRTVAVNDAGEEYTLEQLQALSVADPYIRRSELMVRLRGFEEVSHLLDYEGVFVTHTAPSKYHPFKQGCKVNPKYNSATAREANDYLCKVWERMRACIGRNDIRVFGFRIAEPHHDGTPHHHFLLFINPKDKAAFLEIFNRYALQEDGKESGAKKYRVKVETIDPAKGSAVGYIAKYISKNIDGYGIEEDSYGREAKSSAERIRAWASTHNIRQFQQIGGPSVTTWRELRRMNGEEEGIFEDARHAADSSNWAAYCLVMGGPDVKRALQPIRPAYWQEIDDTTGEMLDPPITRYGYISKGKIFGLSCQDKYYLTRLWRWEVKPKEPEPFSKENEYSALIMHSWGASLFGAERAALEYCQ